MRKICLLIPLLWCLPAFSAVVHVRDCTPTSTGAVTNIVLTACPTVAAGHLLPIFIAYGDNAGTITVSSISDSVGGNTYFCGAKNNQNLGGTSFSQYICWSLLTNGGSSFVVTVHLSTVSDNAFAYGAPSEFSGTDAGGAVDGHNETKASSNTGYQSTGSITTTAAGDLLLAIAQGSTTNPVPSGSWTTIDVGAASAHQIAGAATAYLFTSSTTGSQDWEVNTQAFKAAASSSPAMSKVGAITTVGPVTVQ